MENSLGLIEDVPPQQDLSQIDEERLAAAKKKFKEA